MTKWARKFNQSPRFWNPSLNHYTLTELHGSEACWAYLAQLTLSRPRLIFQVLSLTECWYIRRRKKINKSEHKNRRWIEKRALYQYEEGFSHSSKDIICCLHSSIFTRLILFYRTPPKPYLWVKWPSRSFGQGWLFS